MSATSEFIIYLHFQISNMYVCMLYVQHVNGCIRFFIIKIILPQFHSGYGDHLPPASCVMSVSFNLSGQVSVSSLSSLTVWPMWEQVVRVGWLAVWCPVWPGLVWRLSFLLKIRCLNQCNRRAVLAGRAAKEDTFLDFNLVIFPK